MNRDKLYVAVCTPNDKNLTPYVYGVFVDLDYASEHFAEYGDKDATLRITHEGIVQRVAGPIPEPTVKRTEVVAAMIRDGGRRYCMGVFDSEAYATACFKRAEGDHAGVLSFDPVEYIQTGIEPGCEPMSNACRFQAPKHNIPACTNRIDMDQH